MTCFLAQTNTYGTEATKVCFIVSLLAGRALDWAGPLITTKSPIMNSLEALRRAMISVFDHNVKSVEAAERLLNLYQGRKSVAEFAITFRACSSSISWSDEPLMAIFTRALSEPVRDALSLIEPPGSLDSLVERAIRVDNRLREQGKTVFFKKGSTSVKAPSLGPPLGHDDKGVEPMQVDAIEFRKSKRPTRYCSHCKIAGHTKEYCRKLNEQSH